MESIELRLTQLKDQLIAAQSDAMTMLVVALSQQLDPARLKADLQLTATAARMLPSTSPIALQIVQAGVAAARSQRASPPSEGPYPTRAKR